MHTDDDKNVKVRKDNSNGDYSDFYTSFNDMNNNEDKKEKKSKNKKKKDEPKKNENEISNDDYSNFYGISSDDEPQEIESEEKTHNKSKIVWIIVIAALVILLFVLIFFVFKDKNNSDIILTEETINLQAGETGYISYKLENPNDTVEASFSSSNTDVVIVNNDGQVVGINEGDAEITITYKINGKTKQKKCIIHISGSSNVDKNLSLELKLENGKDNSWTNKNVTINVKATSIYGIENIKYAINCQNNNCDYSDVVNNKIVISNIGTTKVKVLVTDKSNRQQEKTVTILIDKENPEIKLLNDNKNITSTSDVEVCATCTDSLSGCKQSKVCKKFTSSKTNQTIIVEDKAGNRKTSSSFNVTITKNIGPCSLKVSSDGTVTATHPSDSTYYGFNSNYSGNNETSKKITINASKAGESIAQVVTYYIKDNNGVKSKCSLVVIKECKCTDTNSKDANCPTTCKFSSR